METYKRTVAPTLQPITLEEAKLHCAVAGTNDHDEYITALIDRATDTIERHTGRAIMSQTWTLTMENFPGEILIRKPPVTAITYVKYYNTAGTLTTMTATTEYQTDLSADDGPARIKPAYGCVWPLVRDGIYGAVVVTFTAGASSASTVPLAIKHAVAFLVAHWFKTREPIITGTIVAQLPTGLEMLLSLGDWGSYG